MGMNSKMQRQFDTSVCSDVLEAVADRHGIDMIDIETPLGAVIDPDGLDTIWSPSSDSGFPVNGSLVFEFYGCQVTVRSDGAVDASVL